jgi:hypothetical protein
MAARLPVRNAEGAHESIWNVFVGLDVAKMGLAVRMAEGRQRCRPLSIRHHNGHLIQCLWQQCPDVSIVVGGAHAGAWVSFDRVVEAREAERVTEDEHWRGALSEIAIPAMVAFMSE